MTKNQQSILDSYVSAYTAEFDYDIDNYLLLTRSAQRIKDLSSPSSALDLGLGHGYTAEKFSQYYKEYKIVEGSKLIIEDFLNKMPDFNGEIFHTLFENFNIQSKFDNLIMGFILEHVEDPLSLLLQYKKFIKPDGNLFVTVPNYEALNKRIALEAGLITDMNVLSDADKQLGHFRLFSVSSITSLLEKAGYTIDHIEGIYLKPLTSAQLKMLNLSMEILEAINRLGSNYPELSVGILVKARIA